MGTHFDAPVHWLSGRDGDDVASIPPARLVGEVAVIDRTANVERDPDFLLTRADLDAFAAEHGPLPNNGWLLLCTGWSRHVDDADAFVPRDSHWPGIAPDVARWLAQDSPVVGYGVEQVGTDAGLSPTFDPPSPAHHYMHGAGKYGLASLANLDQLPARGALLVVSPLPIVGGSGSPCRVYALVVA